MPEHAKQERNLAAVMYGVVCAMLQQLAKHSALIVWTSVLRIDPQPPATPWANSSGVSWAMMAKIISVAQ